MSKRARVASFSRLFPFVEPKIWQEDFRRDICEKLSDGLNALLKVLLGRHSILRQFSDANNAACGRSCAHKCLTSWIIGDILRRNILFPNWIRYIISISTAGTIGL
jgi:hypothetical protein